MKKRLVTIAKGKVIYVDNCRIFYESLMIFMAGKLPVRELSHRMLSHSSLVIGSIGHNVCEWRKHQDSDLRNDFDIRNFSNKVSIVSWTNHERVNAVRHRGQAHLQRQTFSFNDLTRVTRFSSNLATVRACENQSASFLCLLVGGSLPLPASGRFWNQSDDVGAVRQTESAIPLASCNCF